MRLATVGRWRTDMKDDLIAEFKTSRVIHKYMEDNPPFTVGEQTGAMICDCIKPVVGNNCCCPHCFQITHLLHGLKGPW